MMKNDTLLTVIVFTYNHESSIANCIDSIVSQKTDYAYEVHIWDDCSIDKTSSICQKYAEKYQDKIRLVIQKENTFLRPYLEMQSYIAVSNINTKYFCIIDGDDYWCDESKIQTGLDFLENHPEYIGWAHDTMELNKFTGEAKSYIHETLGIEFISNPVEFSPDAPFFMTSSRIFRSCNFAEKKVVPNDYLLYYYHFSKGPIYYHDKIMAVYVIGSQNTFHSVSNDIQNMVLMFPYKLALLFNHKKDAFCTEYLKRLCDLLQISDGYYKFLLLTKRFLGVRAGWKLWFFRNFVFKHGLACLNINYIYSREKAKKNSDIRTIKNEDERKIRNDYLLDGIKRLQQDINSDRERLKRLISITRKLNHLSFMKIGLAEKSLENSLARKRIRISKARKDLKKLKNEKI